MDRLVLGLALVVGVVSLVSDETGATPREVAPVTDAVTGGEPAATTATLPATPTSRGLALYDRFCLACHGAAGDGRGPATPWLWPPPRDLTRGEMKWRTTASGSPPLDDDLRQTIARGVPGTSMHAFGESLAEPEIDELVRVVKSFAPQRYAGEARAVTIGAPPAVDLERGRAAYVQLGCAQCHGDGGRGDGPAAAQLRDHADRPTPPYDLTAHPLRRPGTDTGDGDGQEGSGGGDEGSTTGAGGGDATVAIYTSLITGLDGTSMPSFDGAAPDAELWAVAAYIDALRYRGDDTADTGPGSERAKQRVAVAPPAIAQARADRIRAGHWTGHGEDLAALLFGGDIPLQGEPPAALAPAQADLDPGRCGRCHAEQLAQWRGSLHATTGSPGLFGQVLRLGDAAAESCLRCHAPLAEQQPRIRPGHTGGDPELRTYRDNPRYDEALRDQGLVCAACHVRGWTRFGPGAAAESSLLPLPGYPSTRLAVYERSDFCLPCHQLQPHNTLAGRPLLNTYREWLEGPYMRRGIQCQHCHMPNREHTWKGVHDPETFRQGIELETIAGRSADTGVVSVRARVTNVGAGHYLPTTPTPAAWLSVELIDARGKPIAGARAERRIGRHIRYNGKRFIEVEDTRIPPGESLELAQGFEGGRVADAVAARVVIRVSPDDYYEGLFTARLRARIPAASRPLFERALARTKESKYVAVERVVPLR